MEVLCVMLYLRNKASTNRLQKCVPRSLITALGVPNLAKMLLLKKSTTTLESLVLVALASTLFDT